MNVNALVVDDNEVNTLILTNMLKACGICADQVSSGSVAVDFSQKAAFDLFFIDHVMPGMDGIQTTMQLRKLPCNEKAVIIALTSNITAEVRSCYTEAGADCLFEKPLKIADLLFILKKWFPGLQINTLNANNCYSKNELIKSFIETMDGIDYQAGLRFAMNNQELYIHILDVSLKNLQDCRNIIAKSYTDNSIDELRFGLHKLCNIYSNIGAVGLAAEAGYNEKALLIRSTLLSEEEYNNCIQNLKSFSDNLKNVVDRCREELFDKTYEIKADAAVMTVSEYEQSLENTIYYIRRYEYDSIKRELEDLIRRGLPENRPGLEQALKDIMNYEYEKALSELFVIKNKTGGFPV